MNLKLPHQKIIVIGPQRSGTNIAAAIIAQVNGLPLYNERDLGYTSCLEGEKGEKYLNLKALQDFIKNEKAFVLQAPALNYICELFPDVFYVWILRPADEIRHSRQRAHWPGEELEREKYLRHADLLSGFDCVDSVDMVVVVWGEYQRERLVGRFLEVEYASLSGFRLWKEEREGLGIGEV